MKVICRANKGNALSKKALSLGNSVASEFELEIGISYIVYGICIFEDVLHYLIIGKDENFPSWYPAELFHVSDNILPIEFYFNFFGYDSEIGVSAIWGYKELVFDKQHYINLIERESEAITVFLKRKHEIEEFNG